MTILFTLTPRGSRGFLSICRRVTKMNDRAYKYAHWHARHSFPQLWLRLALVCTCGHPSLKFASSVPDSTQLLIRGQTGGNGRCHNERALLFACSFFLHSNFKANYPGIPVSHWPSGFGIRRRVLVVQYHQISWFRYALDQADHDEAPLHILER